MPKRRFACSPIGGNIVKRFIGLLVALVLLVSMFALPTFALAEETTEESTRSVGFDVAKFKELVVNANLGLYVEMNKSFKLNQDWLESEEDINALFPGINYRLLPAEEADGENENEAEEADLPAITYTLGGESHAKEGIGAPAKREYKKGAHVTLPAALEAAEGYEFVGWSVPVDFYGNDSAPLLYRAKEQFAMPDHDITVVAVWREKVENAAKPDYANAPNDIICLEYCTPSDDPKDDSWTRVKADSTITLTTSGWWMFRYVVIDGENGEVSDDDAVLTPYNSDEFKAKIKSGEYTRETFCLKRFAVDTSNPQTALSSSMESKMKDGLTVGTSYTISTSLDITDASSTTTTYLVYRFDGANGATADESKKDDGWTLIYDSAATEDRIQNDGDKYITSNGAITPITSDVTEEGNYRYKIVYSVKDSNGYFGVEKDSDSTEEYHPTLLLGVKLSNEGQKTKAKIEAWKIVLFVIAGLSAAGIVALLLIKPKQAVADDARLGNASGNTSANTGAKSGDGADVSTDSTDDAE